MMKQETTMAAVKTLPPATISGMIIWGIPLNEWVLGLTAVWILVQMGFYLYDRFKKK
jgi:hypothetical protein